jgi:hypothetical protein
MLSLVRVPQDVVPSLTPREWPPMIQKPKQPWRKTSEIPSEALVLVGNPQVILASCAQQNCLIVGVRPSPAAPNWARPAVTPVAHVA